jgi:hypothetical protein
MNQRKDLLPPPSIFPPAARADPVVSLLKDQAELMRARTRGTIAPQVQSTGDGDKLRITFTLVVPVLDDYRFQLFWLRKGLDDFPLDLHDGSTSRAVTSMDALEAELRDLFGRQETLDVIEKLIALAENPE